MAFEKEVVSYPQLGGMRTDIPLTSFGPTDAVTARNVRMTTSGRVSRRMGGAKYNVTQLPSGDSVLGIYQFLYGAGLEKFIECAGTVIYTDGGTTQTPIKTGQTAGYYYNFLTFEGFCLMCNGKDAPLKYGPINSASLTIAPLSIAPPIATFIATPGTSGSMATGIYQYWVTFYNPYMPQESQPYLPVSANVTGPSGSVVLTNIPLSTDAQVTERRIYRTTANGSVWQARLLYTILDDTTPTYTDTVADASIINNSVINLSYDPAPTFQKVIISNNRGFGFKANDSTLYYSMPNNPWYWPQGLVDTELSALNYTIPVGEGDGDVITNIVEYYNYVIVFKQRAIYILNGYDETTFQLTRMEFMLGVGCVGPRAALTAMNYCYFVDFNGIYRTNGTTIEYIGKYMQGFFDPNSTSTQDKVNAGELQYSVVALDNRKPLYCIRFSLPSAISSYNDLGLIYDYNDNQWFYDNGYRAQSYCTRIENGVQYLMRGDDYGYVYVENSQDGDGGLITSTATSTGTASTLTDSSLNMSTNFYKGVYIWILGGTGSGLTQKRILSNTATTFTIDGVWDDPLPKNATDTITIGTGEQTFHIAKSLIITNGAYVNAVYSATDYMIGTVTTYNPATGVLVVNVTSDGGAGNTHSVWTINIPTIPDTTSYYTVGGIDYMYLHKWDNYGQPSKTKNWQFVRPRFDADGNYNLTTFYLYDFQSPTPSSIVYNTLLSGATVWDVALWDVGLWDSAEITQNYQRPPANMIHNWSSYGWQHIEAGQQIKCNGFEKIFIVKGWGIR